MEESLLQWRLNGADQPALLCSPGEERALLTGRLLTERTARDLSAIRSVEQKDGIWLAETAGKAAPADLIRRLEAVCETRMPDAPSGEEIRRLTALLGTGGGGTHAALLAAGGKTVLCRDIGRHNALDKAVGRAALSGLPLEGAVLCTTGRLSLEILVKAASVGIRVICTGKQVGSLAQEYAGRWGVRIVEGARESRSAGTKEDSGCGS